MKLQIKIPRAGSGVGCCSSVRVRFLPWHADQGSLGAGPIAPASWRHRVAWPAMLPSTPS